jgi:predicted  nucleic acid-binding Zn-ribbon protein
LSLREKLKALEELQQVDLELNEVQAESEAVPRRRAEIEARVAEAKVAYQAEKARMADNERERRGQEQLLGFERDKVKKWEGRLGEIRTPREYAALSREIDIAKKTNESVSEQLRELGAQAAELQKGLEAAEEQLSEREMASQDELALLAKRGAEQDERIRALRARRAEVSHRVDPGLLAKYENIRRRRAGIAVAPVVDGTCRGCNRNIPPQLNIVLQRADTIEICPNCQRIIYSSSSVTPAAPTHA